jgi:hypothetical protein
MTRKMFDNGRSGMTEDDTFAALKKATFSEMKEELKRLGNIYRHTSNYSEWDNVRDESAKARGWTIREWQQENYRRNFHPERRN